MVSVILLQRRLRNVTINKIIIALVFTVVTFNEFLVYSLQSLRWTNVPLHRDPEEEMVVVLISDPQLIGIQDEMGFPLGAIARWDSDRYLRKTFSRVFHHAQPDVLIFLGDIMDEGSKATQTEYQSYFHRFNNIFHEKLHSKTVIIPGDNDIGGEGFDLRTPFKVNRFETHFENLTGVVNHRFVDFIKLDIRRVRDEVIEKKHIISNMASQLKAPFRIIINHETMITKPKSSIYPILQMAQPSILMSGHWHMSQMFECSTCLSDDEDMTNWPIHPRDMSETEDYIDVDLTNLIALSEIMVPTCSYRMGVPEMGYGVAVIKKSGQLLYTVLWLPSRYTLLYIYIIMLVVVAVLLLIDFVLSPSTPRKTPFR